MLEKTTDSKPMNSSGGMDMGSGLQQEVARSNSSIQSTNGTADVSSVELVVTHNGETNSTPSTEKELCYIYLLLINNQSDNNIIH